MDQPSLDVNQSAPQVIDKVVGQKQAVNLLKVALSAYWTDRAAGRNPSFGHVLMTGGPGLGKTMLAQIIARELAGPFKECLGQTLGMGEDVYGLLMGLADDTTLLVDEAHLANEYVQTILFRAIEERKIFVPKGPLSKKHTAVPLSRFTVVLATTDEHQLLQPLRDRIKLTLRFEFYSPEELAELCRQRATTLRWQVEPEAFVSIGHRSKGTPRLAVRLLESSYRTARAEASDIITARHVDRTCELEGLDSSAGLDMTEQKYLRLLSQNRDKPVRLNVISSVIGLPSRTIADVTEKFLLRKGLIVRCESGRALTEKGMEYVERNLGAKD